MRRSSAPPRRRLGFSLVELLVVMTLISVIGAALTTLLIRQQRFHAAVASVTDARARMRDIATILPTDLRGISSVGDDILDIGLTSMQFQAFVGTAVVCQVLDGTDPRTVVEVPPRILQSGSVLSAWINPPQPNDLAYIYDDGTELGNVDDVWRELVIADTASAANPAWCPSFTTVDDDDAERYRLTLSGAVPATVQAGAPIRFAREVRYSLYQAPDARWYVGYQQCVPSGTPGTPGVCADEEVLAGPVLPATTSHLTSGLYFRYFDQNGNEISASADAASIARVDIGIRTMSDALQAAASLHATAGDSLMFSIGIRNRI